MEYLRMTFSKNYTSDEISGPWNKHSKLWSAVTVNRKRKKEISF